MKHLPSAPFYGRLLALPTNIRLSWKGQTLQLTTNIHKISITLDPSLMFSGMAKSLPKSGERPTTDKHSSLFGKFIRYEVINFGNIGPGRQCYKNRN